jgi:hypothetical protein
MTYVATLASSVTLTFKLSYVNGLHLGLVIVASNGLNAVTFCTNYMKLSKKIIRQSRRFSQLKPV